MGIPPGVPVKAAKVHRALPLRLSRDVRPPQRPATTLRGMPGRWPAAWLAAATATYTERKYSLSVFFERNYFLRVRVHLNTTCFVFNVKPCASGEGLSGGPSRGIPLRSGRRRVDGEQPQSAGQDVWYTVRTRLGGGVRMWGGVRNDTYT